MQNKQAVVGIVAAVLILIGAGAVFTLDKSKTASQPASIAKSVSPTPNNNMSTVAGIFKSTKNQKCDFDTKTANSEVKGTVYVSGDNSYGEFANTANSKTQTMSLIRNDNTFYVWGDALPQGIKMTMSVDDLGQKLSGSQYGNFDPNQKTDIKCVGWTPDVSKFVAPTTVKFLDLTGVSATGAKTSGTQSPSDQCSLCNSMTGNAKATCLSSFSCK